MSKLPENIPKEILTLLAEMANDFPSILENNLVGIYLWGSLTYEAFDKRCSDIDCIVVTRQDVNDEEFSALELWFEQSLKRNPWADKFDMRFVIDNEFLDKNSKCCGFHFGKLVRHGSDGNPIIWVNIGQSGITLWGKPAAEIAPPVTKECLNEALFLELEYLKENLAENVGDKSNLAFFHNSYAVLTACRIFYTAHNKTLVSKEMAFGWTKENIPKKWHAVINTARKNRLAGKGLKTAKLENDAMKFVCLVENRVKILL
jgi:streptomycin 3"-adenylyltransferase